jgi:mRNA interferase MazF
MITFQPGELVLVAFPFTGGGQIKDRPALVILDTGDADVVLARVTTMSYSTPYDIAISDWQGAGLLAPSTVRLHKLATLTKTRVHRRMGDLQPGDRQSVSGVIRQTFGSW